jgi:leader peptidase (prepilin peptidase)/N-methyltransferase
VAGIDIVFVGMLVIVLVPIASTDLRERRIPNILNLILGLLGFAHAMVKSPDWRQAAFELLTMIIAISAFGGTSWAIQRINRHARIGWGDLKFLTAASLWVGVDGAVAVLFVASVISILVTVATAPWSKVSWRQPRPFGPMLAFGMMAVVAVTFTLAGKS